MNILIGSIVELSFFFGIIVVVGLIGSAICDFFSPPEKKILGKHWKKN